MLYVCVCKEEGSDAQYAVVYSA
ncbi:unnamed protein product, partial [Onchocerca ochengi]|uniref:DUF1027 domain-containing protein n=1 Tax=Onchocerca ochengi TaxID=42157 RepID=A0A182EZL8_ONCOC